MKKYIDQIYYEGLGKSIYYPLEKLINKINNNSVRKIINIILKSLYFIIALFIAIMLCYFTI
ncbi:MAG: hypothetical protein IJD92_04550 [Bacilli bacterium]|nr:hypothetical protein [Bacilli bacterium]